MGTSSYNFSIQQLYGCGKECFFFFFENCQNEEDAAVLEKSGFSRITVLPLTGLKVGNVKITRIPAQHGTYKNCGEAMGVMFSAETEKTFYLAGDTVWYYGVQKAINEFKPEVIALNCCAAETKENGRLIMGAEDVWNVWLMHQLHALRCVAN